MSFRNFWILKVFVASNQPLENNVERESFWRGYITWLGSPIAELKKKVFGQSASNVPDFFDGEPPVVVPESVRQEIRNFRNTADQVDLNWDFSQDIPRMTALTNLVTTMSDVVSKYCDANTTNPETTERITRALNRLQFHASNRLPQGVYLESLKVVGLSPKQFQVLAVNTIVRVAPSYFEIPLNVASAAIHGNLKSYGVITNNSNDEAGHGLPEYTHPALLNQAIGVLSDIFEVRPITLRTTLAALILKANDQIWRSTDDVIDWAAAHALVHAYLQTDEFNVSRSNEEIQVQLEIAVEYADLIAQKSLNFYCERVNNLTQGIASQSSLLTNRQKAHQGDLELASQLAVREASASDPDGFIAIFNREISENFLGYSNDLNRIVQGRWWSDVHVNSDLGIVYGYVGHSAEDDHAAQALTALMERIHDEADVLVALESMVRLMDIQLSLWQDTVSEMSYWRDDSKTLAPKPLTTFQKSAVDKMILSSYSHTQTYGTHVSHPAISS